MENKRGFNSGGSRGHTGTSNRRRIGGLTRGQENRGDDLENSMNLREKKNNESRGIGNRGRGRGRGGRGALSTINSKSFDYKKDNNDDSESDEENESERCLICAKRMKIVAITECNHSTCHICALRQRELLGKMTCLVCRTELTKPIIMSKVEDSKQYNDYIPPFFQPNDKLKINFINEESKNAIDELQKYKCKDCGDEFKTFKKLSDHVRSHNKFYCLVCALFKKSFPCELETFSWNGLKKHQNEGNKKIGFTGHPKCEFCMNDFFYSNDELKVHLREKHERCHVCDKIDINNPRYFKDYNELSSHFKNDHYVCMVQSCLDQKFVAFADEFSLQSHILAEHNSDGNLQKNLKFGVGPKRQPNFRSNLSTFTPPNDDILLNRSRIQERAKIYLNHDSNKLEIFKKINEDFTKEKINSSYLLQGYEEIFNTQSQTEIIILLKELFTLIPDSNKYKIELQKLISNKERTYDTEAFPALGGVTTKFSPTWAPSNSLSSISAQKKSNRKMAFPLLGELEASRPSTSVALPHKSTSNSIKYSNLNTTPKAYSSTSTVRKQLGSLSLSDSSARWANGSVSSLSSSSSSSSSSSLRSGNKSTGSDFPELLADNNSPAPVIKRSVKYTTEKINRSNGKVISRSTKTQIPGSSDSGVKITLMKRKKT